ncbi:MAG: YIP1 family protein [Acidobacteriota bacterium]
MDATSSSPPPVAVPPIPWEDPARPGFFDRFVDTVRLMATAPGQAFQRMPTAGGIARPLLFGGMWLPFIDKSQLGEVGAAFGLSTGMTIVMMVVAPILVIIGVFIQAAILHLMLMLIGGANNGFEATTRVCSYAYTAQLAQILPFCGGILATVWSLILLIVGLATTHRITHGKAAVAVVLPLVLCCAFTAALLFMGVLAGVAASR